MKLDHIHISWSPEGEELSNEEKDAIKRDLIAKSEKDRGERDKAVAALQGLPYAAVPITQLADIYERMLRLVRLGQTNVNEFCSLPEAVRALRREVFAQADFGAVFAGQWLPKDVREQVRNKVKKGESN